MFIRWSPRALLPPVSLHVAYPCNGIHASGHTHSQLHAHHVCPDSDGRGYADSGAVLWGIWKKSGASFQSKHPSNIDRCVKSAHVLMPGNPPRPCAHPSTHLHTYTYVHACHIPMYTFTRKHVLVALTCHNQGGLRRQRSRRRTQTRHARRTCMRCGYWLPRDPPKHLAHSGTRSSAKTHQGRGRVGVWANQLGEGTRGWLSSMPAAWRGAEGTGPFGLEQ